MTQWEIIPTVIICYLEFVMWQNYWSHVCSIFYQVHTSTQYVKIELQNVLSQVCLNYCPSIQTIIIYCIILLHNFICTSVDICTDIIFMSWLYIVYTFITFLTFSLLLCPFFKLVIFFLFSCVFSHLCCCNAKSPPNWLMKCVYSILFIALVHTVLHVSKVINENTDLYSKQFS